jgi:hypothetical protein
VHTVVRLMHSITYPLASLVVNNHDGLYS